MDLTKDIATAVSSRNQKDSSPSNQKLIDFKARCVALIKDRANRAIRPPLPEEDPMEFERVNFELPYLTDNAKVILEKRYLPKEVIETPVQMFARVALKLALVEVDYEIETKC